MADEAVHGPGVDREPDIIEGQCASEAFTEMPRFEDGRSPRSPQASEPMGAGRFI